MNTIHLFRNAALLLLLTSACGHGDEPVAMATDSDDCIRRIYGRRFDYQGEFEFAGFEDDGSPILDDPESRVMFFHDEIGDAAVHFWCTPDAAARGDFADAKFTSSCT